MVTVAYKIIDDTPSHPASVLNSSISSVKQSNTRDSNSHACGRRNVRVFRCRTASRRPTQGVGSETYVMFETSGDTSICCRGFRKAPESE